jgi:hypothetical protein
MDFRDRTTRDTAADIAQLLATACQCYRRARRVCVGLISSPR